MRPAAPVPFTLLRSILFSRAILRTRGESSPAVSSTTVATGAADSGLGGSAPSACGEGGGGAGAGVEAAAAGATPLPAPSLILPTTVLIPTVFPSSTTISASVPAVGDGISVSTLSV